MMVNTWIQRNDKTAISCPIAIVGSSGLRSVGMLVTDHLISELQATVIARLYSSHFPLFYQTSPSYASMPQLPGKAGIAITHHSSELPKIEFYYSSVSNLLIIRGYHANFFGQYEAAEKTLDFFEELGIERTIVIAGYARDSEAVCCAATSLSLLEEMKQYAIEPGYEGPFYGYSGLVFGLTALRDIEGICLFGRTKPNLDFPECPDPTAARLVLERLTQILNVNITLPDPSEDVINRST
jgi:proteasome assembly chaperone (PAC2) family protein